MDKPPDQMVPLPLADFLVGNRVPVNLYVRLSDEKFVVIAKAGAPINKDQLKSYNDHEVQYLWVRRDEFSKIAGQSVSLAGIIVGKKDVEFRSKTAVLASAASTVFTQLDHMGLSIEMYNNARMVTEAVVGLCDTHRELVELFESLRNCSDYLLAHSLAVAAVSVLIGQGMGFEKKITLEKLSLGGLLHDVGKKALPPELLKKAPALMTPEEISLMETHPYRGMQMMLSLGIVPDDIVSIIYEHHENSIGQGYPQRIRDVKIHPLAKIVGLADQFVSMTLTNPNCPISKNPREALMYIEHTMGQPFNKECFRALKRVVGKDMVSAA